MHTHTPSETSFIHDSRVGAKLESLSGNVRLNEMIVYAVIALTWFTGRADSFLRGASQMTCTAG